MVHKAIMEGHETSDIAQVVSPRMFTEEILEITRQCNVFIIASTKDNVGIWQILKDVSNMHKMKRGLIDDPQCRGR
tara:strand:- start:1 stop:228 length:228 start_codon:yes stop_codon:yes gene_type:complete